VNKLTGNIHLCNIERFFLLLVKVFIIAFIVIGITQCVNSTGNEKKTENEEKNHEEVINQAFLTISPEAPYIFRIEFHQDSLVQFQLWFPELAIFDCDSSRAFTKEVTGQEWVTKTQTGFSVVGKIDKNNMKIKFKYKIIIFSDETVKLELEVKNAGKLPWSNYAQLAVCLSPFSKTFSDTIGNKTLIHVSPNLIKPLTETGEVKKFNHYPVMPRNDAADPEQRIQVVSGFVSRFSHDRKSMISFFWDETARVDVNPGGVDCIHSHPAIGPLNPGEIINRTGFIVLTQGNAQESYKIVQNLLEDEE